MHVHSDDIAIIQKVLQGQQAAYATLVERYQSYVFTLVMRYVNDRELAEELAQDVFVKAYKFLADFKGNSKFSTWLYTIVHTTCLTRLRKKKEDVLLFANETMISLSDSHLIEHPSVSHEHKARKALVDQAMKHLPAEDAEVLTLFYLAEQSIDEISIIMGLTVPNVKVRLFRARQKMKSILENKFSRIVD